MDLHMSRRTFSTPVQHQVSVPTPLTIHKRLVRLKVEPLPVVSVQLSAQHDPYLEAEHGRNQTSNSSIYTAYVKLEAKAIRSKFHEQSAAIDSFASRYKHNQQALALQCASSADFPPQLDLLQIIGLWLDGGLNGNALRGLFNQLKQAHSSGDGEVVRNTSARIFRTPVSLNPPEARRVLQCVERLESGVYSFKNEVLIDEAYTLMDRVKAKLDQAVKFLPLKEVTFPRRVDPDSTVLVVRRRARLQKRRKVVEGMTGAGSPDHEGSVASSMIAEPESSAARCV